MMNKIIDLIRKNIIAFISFLIVFIIGLVIILLIPNKISLITIDTNYYSFKYDNTWSISDKKDDGFKLKHKSGSNILVQITSISDDYKYSSLDEMIDEIIYNLQSQNSSYKMISKKNDRLTKKEYDGYKFLYENDNSQVMVCLFKKNDKLVSIIYEANNDYFDILLDSVHNIIYNLDIKEEKFDIKNSISIETSNIDYSKNIDYNGLLDSSRELEIADYNYYVKLSVPSLFIRSAFESRKLYLKYSNNNYWINVSSYISNSNIYEYLDSEKTLSISSYCNSLKNDDNYLNVTGDLSKPDNGKYSYIYRCSYDTKKYFSDDFTHHESIDLLYDLDNNHYLKINIESSDCFISKELIDSINVVETKNYSSYVKIEKDGDYLLGTLKKMEYYDESKVVSVNYKIPLKYQEIDDSYANLFATKSYVYGDNNDLDVDDYEIKIVLSTSKPDSFIDSYNYVTLNKYYKNYKQVTYSNDITIGDKVFKVYEGFDTRLSRQFEIGSSDRKYYTTNHKVLCYQISDKDYLYIEIKGNNKNITNEMINDFTNFTINKNY